MGLMPTDPKQQKAMVVGVAAVAVLYFANSFWLDPKRETNEGERATLEQLEGSNRTAQLDATRGGRDLEALMAVYERHIAQLERLIPAEEQFALLISDISSLARTEGVDVQSLRPDGSEPVGVYTKETYYWSAMGDYHDIARFLSLIASMERIVTPVDMDIQVVANAGTDNQTFVAPVLATFRIQTYVIPDVVDAGPLPQGSGGDR